MARTLAWTPEWKLAALTGLLRYLIGSAITDCPSDSGCLAGKSCQADFVEIWCILEVDMALVKIAITLKPTLLDAQGRVVQGALHALGYENVEQVRIGKYMELRLPDGPEIEAQVRDMCEKLLANPVIEDFSFEVER